METYGAALILWRGGEEAALTALHVYHRAVRPFRPERDAVIMSNTWGDGHSDGRIREDFLLGEIRAAGALGVTCVQIDDGWQQGITKNSVLSRDGEIGQWSGGFYRAERDFWAVNPDRLPRGLEPLAELAGERGVALGLWFSPDAQEDYARWERDSETILALHRRYGVRAFKLDGVMFRNKRAEDNFVRLLRRVTAESGGAVTFNLDTTSQVRGGYFGRVQYGTLFLENRYAGPGRRWPVYWPHRPCGTCGC